MNRDDSPEWIEAGKALRSLPRYSASAELRGSVESLIRAEANKAEPRWPTWGWGALAASALLALGAGYGWGHAVGRADSVFADAVADHVRSLQASHLFDVISTDQHTVKPWFIGKVDFSPPVVDLANIGFPLAGGRLDRIDGQSAVALVYHRRLHSLNVFIWPASGGRAPDRRVSERGYNAQSWSDGEFNFVAVSEVPREDLEQFVKAFQAKVLERN